MKNQVEDSLEAIFPCFLGPSEVDPRALHLDVVIDPSCSLLGAFQVVLQHYLDDDVNPSDARGHHICLTKEELQLADDGRHALRQTGGWGTEVIADKMLVRGLGQGPTRDVLVDKCEIGQYDRHVRRRVGSYFFSAQEWGSRVVKNYPLGFLELEER